MKEHGGYILPKNVPANQFMNLEGRKISTSKNWAVWVHEYLEDFEGRQDELRYNMIKNMPEQQDSEFTWKRFQESNNNELVGNLANFINRVLVLTNKYFEGKVPNLAVETVASSDNQAEQVTPSVELAKLLGGLEKLGSLIEAYDFRSALQALMDISTQGNQLLQFNEPWKTFKTNPEAAGTVLNLGIQIVKALTVASQPFLPFMSAKLCKMLNINDLQNGDWSEMIKTLQNGDLIITEGHQMTETQHLFTRIADEVIEAQIKKLEDTDMVNNQAAEETAEPATPLHEESFGQYLPLKSEIVYDDFDKIDIRTGTILEAEKVPKADKLLKLSVDLGFEVRTIVSGIAEHFNPADIIGLRVLVVANLAPRKLRGIESNGMILTAENSEGKLGLVSPPEGWMNGSNVK